MSRVEPNRNVYIGHRYVPLLVGEWDKSIQYEGLSIVTFKGASYTSKKMTPPGIDIENEEYWVLTGNYNAQVEYYRLETERVSDDLAQAKIDLNKRIDDTVEYVDTNVEDLTIYVNDEVRETKEYVDGEVLELTGFVNEEIEKTVKKDSIEIDVRNHGAYGTGENITVGDVFSSLNEARGFYPFVDNLNSTMDYVGIQQAINEYADYKTIIIPSGEYIINEGFVLPENTEIVGSNNTILNVIRDITVFKLNFDNKINGFTFKLKEYFNGDIFEISSDTLEDSPKSPDYRTDLGIIIENIVCQFNRSINEFNYEGTVFHIWASENKEDGTPYKVDGFWNLTVDNVKTTNYHKYFCRNYYKTGWITSMNFSNIKISTAKYMFFGSKSENTMDDYEYSDSIDLYLDNSQFQWNNSKHFAFFTKGGKYISKTKIWDWGRGDPDAKRKFLLSDDITKYNTKIYMDNVDGAITEQADFLNDNVSDREYQNLRIFNIENDNQLTGNMRNNMKGLVYQGTFNHIGSMATPIYNIAHVETASGTNYYNVILQHLRLYDISISVVNAGGALRYSYECSKDISDIVDILFEEVEENKINIIFKFKTNMGYASHYVSTSTRGSSTASQGSKPLVFSQAYENYDETNTNKMDNISKGVYVPQVPNEYNPFGLSSSKLENHIYMNSLNGLNYKIRDDYEETIPRRRIGASVIESGGQATINFETFGSSSYRPIITKTSNEPGEVFISNKTSTSFIVNGPNGMEFDYVVIY